MAIADIQEYLQLIPAVNRAPQHAVWLTATQRPTHYTSIIRSQVMPLIVRHRRRYNHPLRGHDHGFTVLHASKRLKNG